jgi:hypothetical protein
MKLLRFLLFLAVVVPVGVCAVVACACCLATNLLSASAEESKPTSAGADAPASQPKEDSDQ